MAATPTQVAGEEAPSRVESEFQEFTVYFTKRQAAAATAATATAN